MSENRRYPSLVGPIILIGFGVLVLLSNLGMLQWSVWDAILKLWPLLLVAAGLVLLIGRRSAIGNLLVGLLLVAMLVGGVWWISGEQGAGMELTGTNVSQPLEGARSAEVEVQVGAALLRVSGGAPAGKLLEGVAATDKGVQPVTSSRVENDIQKFSLRAQAEGASVTPWSGRRGCDVRLTDQVPMALRLKLGAGDTVADLRGLQVTEVSSDVGAGRTVLTLPAGAALKAQVNLAVGEVIVRVPKGSAVRVTLRTAVGLSRLPNGATSFGQASYTSPGYESAAGRVDLEVTVAVGMVTVEEY